MRVLQLGDTHLGMATRTLGGPAGWSRAEDHLAAFEAALAPALRGEVELVVHTGDLFDRSRPPPQAVARAVSLLDAVARCVPVVVLAGNHDRRGLRPHLGRSREGLHIVDTATRLSVAGLEIALVPHVRQAAAWTPLAASVVGSGVDLLVCHQGFCGAHVPGFRFRVGQPAETVGEAHLPAGRIDAVMSGHIHPRQVVRWGPHTVVYAGSTERTSVSEAHQAKGSVVWTVGARWSHRFIDGPSRPWWRLQHAHELDRITPGDLVSLPAERLSGWGSTVVARGGRLVLPRARTRPPRRQLRLF